MQHLPVRFAKVRPEKGLRVSPKVVDTAVPAGGAHGPGSCSMSANSLRRALDEPASLEGQPVLQDDHAPELEKAPLLPLGLVVRDQGEGIVGHAELEHVSEVRVRGWEVPRSLSGVRRRRSG